MMKWIIALISFVTLSTLCLFVADAGNFEDLVDSAPRGIEGHVGEILAPISNVNDSIQYRLYTRSNLKDPCFVEPTPEEFDHCAFNPKLKTKILIHGFLTNMRIENYFMVIKDALLDYGSYNVIIVDWCLYNGHPYSNAVLNTKLVGEKIAEFIKFVKKHTGARYSSFHLIGHSLGAHTAGIAGKNICNLGRITGLDPAGPLFELNKRDTQLDYTDAQFVDVIHSSDELSEKGLGKFEPIGHMDFYPNGGHFQEACETGNSFGDIKSTLQSPHEVMCCNHDMCMKFFVNSIRDCDYLSTQCEDYESLPICSSQGNPTAKMGFHAKPLKDLPPHSKFYIKTTEKEPFC